MLSQMWAAHPPSLAIHPSAGLARLLQARAASSAMTQQPQQHTTHHSKQADLHASLLPQMLQQLHSQLRSSPDAA